MKFTVIYKGSSASLLNVISEFKNSKAEVEYNSFDKIAMPTFLSQLIILKDLSFLNLNKSFNIV